MTPPSAQLYIEFEQRTKVCVCLTCDHGEAKQPLSNFSLDTKKPDGFNSRCRDCANKSYLIGIKKRIERCKVTAEAVDESVLKVCTKCKTLKPLGSFHKSNKTKDGRKEVCKQCRSTRKPRVPKASTPRPEFKICSNKKCHLTGIYQPIDNFYEMNPSLKFKHNLDSQCKACRSTYAKASLERRKDYIFPPEATRVCRECGGDPQPIDNFSKCSAKRGGRSTVCKACDKKRLKKWNEENKEEQKSKRRQSYLRDADNRSKAAKDRRFSNFGVNLEWYKETLAAQGGGCDICGTTNPMVFGGRFAIDHDHNCCGEKTACDKCRRGLLCFPCNARLAHLEEKWAINAFLYLKKHGKDLSPIFDALTTSHLSDAEITAPC